MFLRRSGNGLSAHHKPRSNEVPQSARRRTLARGTLNLQVRPPLNMRCNLDFPGIPASLVFASNLSRKFFQTAVQYLCAGWPRERARWAVWEFANRDYWERYFKEFRCSDCGSSAGFRSRPRTLSEKYILPILMFQPVRCGDCFHRFYLPVSVPVRERGTGRKGPHVPMHPPSQHRGRVA